LYELDLDFGASKGSSSSFGCTALPVSGACSQRQRFPTTPPTFPQQKSPEKQDVIDINSAGREQLMTLPGIDESLHLNEMVGPVLFAHGRWAAVRFGRISLRRVLVVDNADKNFPNLNENFASACLAARIYSGRSLDEGGPWTPRALSRDPLLPLHIIGDGQNYETTHHLSLLDSVSSFTRAFRFCAPEATGRSRTPFLRYLSWSHPGRTAKNQRSSCPH